MNDIRITVEYADETRVGGPLSEKLQNNFREMFSPIYAALDAHGPKYVIGNAERLMGNVRGQPLFDTLRDPSNRLRIAPDALYPAEELIYPVGVTLERVETGERMRLGRGENHHEVVARLLGPVPDDSKLPGDVTFAGHNAVRIASDQAAVLVDPWLVPASTSYGDYQPIGRREIGRVDAILLTHSHPDHYDPGSLLQFHPSTRIIVPRVERESLLSANLEFRLRQLGFENVEMLDWWSETTAGDIAIAALPFYGEQPTNSSQICPEVRMAGNTYLVRTPRFSCALVADSGRDRDGDVRDVGLEARRRWGPIDVLFSGYRGWSLYPIQYFESSVRQYLLFVPQELYTVRQSIMNGAAEAADTAEAWGAQFLTPYGDGGAPWYADLGLGPDPRTAYRNGAPEWVHFDPLPERVAEELRARSSPAPGLVVASRVKPLLLRPGQSVEFRGGLAEILEIEGHRWPLYEGVMA
jgi:L-ascorbate metabolism protein UlaG (beta-lactamase superfamily)